MRFDVYRVGFHRSALEDTITLRCRLPSQFAQRLLGHASIVTTEKHYASLASSDLGPSLEIVGRLASQPHSSEATETRHDVATPLPGKISSRSAQVIYG